MKKLMKKITGRVILALKNNNQQKYADTPPLLETEK